MRHGSWMWATAAVTLLATAPVHGQDQVLLPTRAAPAWLGFGYEVEWLKAEGTCAPRVVIESVVQGAPADRAGLRPGDALTRVNGASLTGARLRILGSHLNVGDSVRLHVSRSGRDREIVAVAGRRPDRPPVALDRRAVDGLEASGLPVIHVRADTLVARNLETLAVRRDGAYWLAHENGRTEYRRMAASFREDPVDRQVADLLVCAQRTLAAAPGGPAPVRVSLKEVQERADSFRVVINRRALNRAESVPSRPTSLRAVEVAPAPAAPGPGVQVYTYRVADHVSAAARGVAGAEVTPLEPELAEYFPGARNGLLVLRVAPGTPADRAGIRPGDVLTAGGGRSLSAVVELRTLLALPDPAPVELRLVRHGRTRTVTMRRD